MMNIIKKRRAEIIIFCLSIFFSMAVFSIRSATLPGMITNQSKGFFTSDSFGYLDVAKNFIKYRSLSTIPAELGFPPDATLTPGYPLFLVLLSYIHPAPETIVNYQDPRFYIIIQNIISALATVLVFRIGKKFFSAKVGFLSAVLFAIESEKLHVTNAVMSDILAVFFFLISLAALMEFYKTKRLAYLCGSGALLGLSNLMHPSLQAAILIFVMFIILTNLGVLVSQKKYFLKAIVVLLFSYVVIMMPWSIRNYIHFKTFQFTSILGVSVTNITIPFFESNFFPDKGYLQKLRGEKSEFVKEVEAISAAWPKFGKDFWAEDKFVGLFSLKMVRDMNYDIFKSGFGGFSWEFNSKIGSFAGSDYQLKRGMAIIMRYPFHFGAYHLRNVAVAMTTSAASFIYKPLIDTYKVLPNEFYFPFLYYGGKLVWMAYYLFILLFFILFFRKSAKEKRDIYLLFCVIIAYFSMLFPLGGSPSRYRLLVDPLIFMLALNSFFEFVNYFKNKRQRLRP